MRSLVSWPACCSSASTANPRGDADIEALTLEETTQHVTALLDLLETHPGCEHAGGSFDLSVRYTTSTLVNELAEADAARRLSSVIARYSKIGLLCLDEFGYLNLDRKGANLLVSYSPKALGLF